MRRSVICLCLVLCLILSSCSWMSGSYVSVEPHRERNTHNDTDVVSASNYLQLRAALENLIRSGAESGIINVSEFNQSAVKNSVEMADRYVRNSYPIGAYAVESIDYEIGTNAGKPAISVEIEYMRSRTDILSIRNVADMKEARKLIEEALKDCDSSVIMMIDSFVEQDFAQLVTDYAEMYPQYVMEIPQVSVGIYPDSGAKRVVELTFAYQTSRETLRQMQSQVTPVFNAAALYVSGEGADTQKYAQLYAFLMERFDYEITTSITPAYSLLRHGVGDNRAFALVYAAMCRLAGLECMTVTGTRNGEPWCWNIITDNENHFHIDLLRSSAAGGFKELTDDDMDGYVWDYSAYPECLALPQNPPELPVQTEPTVSQTVETVPETEESLSSEETQP